MKLLSLVMLLLVVKTKASYFDDFRGAMSSVESAFGKLLNDVVSDVKTTVHCTILAMEQVLAINGVMSEPLPNKECNNDDDSNTDTETSGENVAQEIHSSISKVNETLSHILDNTGHERLNDVRRVLKHESNRLTEVSSLLRTELEKISHRMKKEFQNVELNSDTTSLDSVRNDMKKLFDMEKKDKTASKEIGEVLNEALNMLHINKINKGESDEEKIKVIMRELEQESPNNNVSNNVINQEHPQSKEEFSTLRDNLAQEQIPADITKNVKNVATNAFNNAKEVAKEAFKHNDEVVKNVAHYLTDKSNNVDSNKQSVDKTPTKKDVSNSEYEDKEIEEALSGFKEAAKTQALLDSFFAKEHGSNAFENPDLLNFTK